MGTRTVRIVAIALVVASTLVWTRPAHAKAEMLKRSISNVLQAPLDFALMPYTFGESLIVNFYMGKRRSVLEKVLLSVPVPFIWAVYTPPCVFMSGYLPSHRMIEGALLMPAAIALSWTDVDIHLYDPVHGKRGALVDKPPFYFGGRYCEGFFK